MIIFTFIFLMYKVDSTILWEKRFLDPIVIKAKELGLNQKVDLDQIIVFSKIGIITSQIDEIKKEKDENKEKEEYYEGDGKFDGEDELCFYARYCGEKINEDEIRKYDFEKIFEVELKDLKEKEKRFCYIGIKKKEEKEKSRNIIIEEGKEVKENKEQLNNLPKIIPEKLEFKNSENEFIVYQGNRTAFFSTLLQQ